MRLVLLALSPLVGVWFAGMPSEDSPPSEGPPPSVETVLGQLDSDDPDVRSAAIEALSARGEAAGPALIAAVQSERYRVFAGACRAVHEMEAPPADVVPYLVREFDSDDADRARVAVMVLAAYGPRAAAQVPQLRRTLAHRDFHVRYTTCRTLAAIGPAAGAAVPDLLVRLTADASSVRGHAALALGAIGVVAGRDVVAALLAASSERNDTVRERALRGLGRIGPAARDALPNLQARLANATARNRVPIAFAVARISETPHVGVAALIELTDDFGRNLDAIAALAELGPTASAAVPKLTALLEADDPDIRHEAILALAAIAPEASRTAIERAAENDADESIREAAKRALAKFDPVPK